MSKPVQNMDHTLRVLFMAAEADPLVKVGGLGDVAGSLPMALRAIPPEEINGHALDVRLVIPFHPAVRRKVVDPFCVASFDIPRGAESIHADVYETQVKGVPVYLISGAPIDMETGVYSTDPHEDGEKYVFFSLAALELARQLNWQPDIVHANDWHTAAALYAISRQRATDDFYAHTRTVLSIHNLPFMGAGTEKDLESFGLPASTSRLLPRWARHFPLALGLLTADKIIAVSPSYSNEILTPEFGCNLQDFLTTRRSRLMGILNGLDEAAWDPTEDPALPVNFDFEHLENRLANKRALLQEFSLNPQKAFGLPEDEVPLLILISRMDQQKGIDLAVEGLRQLGSDQPWMAILLGSGDPTLENECRCLEIEHPDRVRAAIRFDLALSRRMYGGGDMLLMPSRYEPCGLAQMIGMRYGCVPVARAVGGLRDTIQDVTQPSRQETGSLTGTGFLFENASGNALAVALKRALTIYPQRDLWHTIQINGMQQDFSWQRFALMYAQTYLKLKEGK